MKGTTSVIMAAGIGGRFGGGIRQLELVGPDNEIIMDYSTRDAIEAGFNKAIFIARRDLEEGFREIIRYRIEKLPPMGYAYQELQDLLAGYEATPGRTKPWEMGQAVPSVKDIVDGPLLVINADGYYRREGSRRIHNYMTERMDSQPKTYNICMGGFVLSNTLSSNDTVTRGVCQVDGDGSLTSMTETYNIQMKEDELHATDESGAPVTISPFQSVPMNMWGLSVSFIQELKKGSPVFLDSLKEGDTKSEYPLPKIIDNLAQNRKARVTVLDTPDRRFGATYKEDKQAMTDAIRGLIESGVYEEKLFG